MNQPKIPVSSRAHRNLKALSRYHDLSGNKLPPPSMPALPVLSAGEEPVGYYENDPSSFSDVLFFSTTAVYVFRAGHWSKVLYQDIERSISPKSKQNVSGFNLLLRNGEQFWLPVTGSKDSRFFDAFAVLRFFINVVGDLKTTV
jgi:hypothetical protein